jgi:hypothetical protein
MAETDLSVVGKDTKLVATINGAPFRVHDQITSYNVEALINETETNVLGKSASKFDSQHRGWQLSIELAVNNADADEVVDTLLAAYRAGVPVAWAFMENTRFRDGSSKGYTYPGLRMTAASKRVSNGETTKISITAKTGAARVAS